MKRKLWSVLLLAVLTTVLLSTAAAADGWGTGGWDVAKRQTEWKPDGVWAEGEYYSVDPDARNTMNIEASDDYNRELAENLDYRLAMSWDEDYLYTYISYHEPNGYVVTPDLWDGNVIQFSGTDVGNETIYDENGVKDDPRLEVGFAMDFDGNVTEVGSKVSINWCNWLDDAFGHGTYFDEESDKMVYGTDCADDFDVFFCDGWVTVEFRVPFSAFSKITPAVGKKVGVAYVISVGNGNDGEYALLQIGEGITGRKHAEKHSPITLTAAPVIPERTGNAYYILFHNIGMTNPHSKYLSYYESGNSLQYYGTDGAEDTAYVDDLFALLPEDVREELLNVEGHHFVNFRPAYWNCIDEVGSVVENRHFDLEDKVSLEDVQEYAFYDGFNWCIMFTACYDPDMYTVKFNNIGNVDNWDDTNYYAAQKVEDVPFGINFYDIFPYEEDYPALFNVPGHYFDRWRVLDFTKEIENPGYEQQYQGRAAMHYGGAANEEGTYPLDSFIAEHASVMEGDEYPVITLRAVYLPHWYTIRFVDDDGVTELCDSVQLRIWEGIRAHFPAVPTKDYGTFTNWKLDWVNGEDGFYTMWYDDENNPDYAIDANLIERCAVDTDDDGVADTITLVAEYELNEDAGDLRASGVIETEKGDIQWEVHWNGLLYVGNQDPINGLVIPDFAPEWDNPDPSAQAPWYPYRTYITELEIGSEIEVLGECAFNGLRQLRSIFIPGNVKRVEMHAFAGCENVERIDIEDDGVEFLGWNVFADIHVDELYIPASLQEIVPGAFASMGTNWYAVNGANPAYFDRNGVLFGYAESGRPLLLAYPKARESSSYALPAGTEAILRTAFQFCQNLEEVTLNSDLLALEDMAFAGSTIHSVEIPASVIFMGDEVFNNCENLTSATFNGPVPVNGIGERNFNNTAEDFTIYYLEGQDGWSTPEWNGYPAEPLPRGEYRAEGTCPAWNEKGELYWHITWDGTLYIEGVEGTCDEGEYGIPDAFVYEEEPVYSPWHQWRNFVTEIVFAENIWVIGDSAFYDFDALEEIELPGYIRWMGDWVFGDCDNLRNIWLNEGLEGLGANSLGNACLDTLWIPSTLNTLSWVNNGEAFFWLTLNRFEVAEENPYFFTGDAGELYYDRFGECKLIAVPSNYGGTVKVLDGTTALAGCAFGNSQAKGVILPDTLEYIDWHAFHFMENIRELHIPASVRYMNENVFHGCSNLEKVFFHGNAPEVHPETFLTAELEPMDFSIYYLEGTNGWSMPTWDNPETDWNDEIPCYPFSMRDNQFSGAIKDTDITWYITMDGKLYVNGSGEIPDYIWDYEGNWHGCLGAVRGIYLDDGFTRIGECAFNGVSYVSELKLPENLKEIGQWAFNGNNNHLGELDLPDQVEKLDYAAFHDMGVTRVIIPASTNLIVGNVFAGCPVEEYVVAEDNTAYMNDGFGVLYCYGEGGKIVELTAYPVVSELTEYIVPEGEVEIWGKTYDFAVTDLDLHAVHWTWNLEKITLPETLRV
ncbi:MAG: leucine-rich repeat protein, partial [Clostridia bacterium]|nr:leucine-rich repeat protein [Clostridia bacterium]